MAIVIYKYFARIFYGNLYHATVAIHCVKIHNRDHASWNVADINHLPMWNIDYII